MDRWKNGPHFSSLSLYSRFPSVILLTDLTVAFARTSCLKHILHHCFVTHLDVSHGRQQQQRFQQGRKQRQPETYSLQIFPCMHISFRFYHSVSFLVKGITPSVFSIVFFLLLPDNPDHNRGGFRSRRTTRFPPAPRPTCRSCASRHKEAVSPSWQSAREVQ